MTTYEVGSSLWDLIDRRADATPDLVLAVDEIGRHITFGEYRQRVVESAAGLAFVLNGHGAIARIECADITLNTYVARREDLVRTANDLFDVVASGAVKIPVNQKYPLKDAQKAHRELESRGTTGSSILVP